MGDGEWTSTSMPYVTPDPEGVAEAWESEAAAKGGRGTQRVVRAGEEPAPSEVAEVLEVPAGTSVVVRRRVMYLDDVPCELTDTYYPADIARGTGLAGTAKIRGGAVKLLADLGHTGARVREDVLARMPTEAEREALQLPLDEPVLQLTRLTTDDADRPIQADVMVMRARSARLRYEIGIG